MRLVFTTFGLFLASICLSVSARAVQIDVDHEYAVHATDQFQIRDGKIVILGKRKPLTQETRELILKANPIHLARAQIASKEKGTDFRPTSHWSLGELVRSQDDQNWDNRKYVLVVPFSRLLPQVYSLSRGDVAVLGDLAFEPNDIVLIARKELEEETLKLPAGKFVFYGAKDSLREVVNNVILEKGGLSTMNAKKTDPKDPRWEAVKFLMDGVDFNSKAFFEPVLKAHAHIIFGIPLNTRFESLFLNDYFWTSEGQDLRDKFFPGELMDLVNAVGKWQLDQATRQIRSAPFPEQAKQDFYAQRDRIYASMRWNAPAEELEISGEDPDLSALSRHLEKFSPPLFSSFIKTHFSRGTRDYQYILSNRDRSRPFMRDLAFLPTPEAMTFVRNSTLDLRTKNAIVAYVYFSKFLNLTEQIKKMNAHQLKDNSTLLSHSVLALPVRTLQELGAQQFGALKKLEVAIERLSLGREFAFTNPIEMAVTYDIMAESMEKIHPLKEPAELEKAIYKKEARDLITSSVPLSRLLFLRM